MTIHWQFGRRSWYSTRSQDEITLRTLTNFLQTCAFTSANNPAAVTLVYLRAIAPHSSSSEARRLILRRIKEALLKGTWLFGVPRALNTFYALAKVIPDEESVDREVVRADVTNPLAAELVDRGLDYFENIYRKDMPLIFEPMDRLFPDLRMCRLNSDNSGK